MWAYGDTLWHFAVPDGAHFWYGPRPQLNAGNQLWSYGSCVVYPQIFSAKNGT